MTDAAKRPGTDLAAYLSQRHVGPAIIERAVRLNPEYRPGYRLRGIHRTSSDDPRWAYGWVSKGEFMRAHGRAAWAALPRRAVMKRGKRMYVTREAVQDRVWMRH